MSPKARLAHENESQKQQGEQTWHPTPNLMYCVQSIKQNV